MARRRLPIERLKAALAKHDKAIQAAFVNAIRGKASSINIVALADAIESRDFNRALNIAGINRADMFPFDQSLSSAYMDGGMMIAQSAPAFAARLAFDGRATRAEAWARGHVGNLVAGIVNDQLDMLRDVIGNQLAAGQNPRAVANQIAGAVNRATGQREGGFIGLTRGQAGYVANARAELQALDGNYFTRTLRDRRFDAIVRKAIASDTPLSSVDIDRITTRYSDRLLQHRATTIARTESITALRAGRREGILQAIEQGVINGDAVKRVWSATMDDRTREDHAEMNGAEVDGMNTPFELPDGSLMMYPGDTSLGADASQTINCRCYDEHVVDWLRP